jgi:hypothetical protein
MQIGFEVTHDGPYLRIVLPDVVPPDWEALRRTVDFECGEPVARATIVAPRIRRSAGDEPLRGLIRQLQRAGATVVVAWRTA